MRTDRLVSEVPELRVRTGSFGSTGSFGEVRADGSYVLYWMIANRRPGWNYSLQRAIDWALALQKPLVVLEALRSDYRWASDRFHHFVIQGMADNSAHFRNKPVFYYPYLEPEPSRGAGLLKSLAADACMVVSDDFPCFFLPKILRAAARQIRVRFELVDSNGIVPMRATEKTFLRAFDFRRFLQKRLPDFLLESPAPSPFSHVELPLLDSVPETVSCRWPIPDVEAMAADLKWMRHIPIDHQVGVASARGGFKAAEVRLGTFLENRLHSYGERPSHLQEEGTSGLSPYLHFGHISAHEIVAKTLSSASWSFDRLAERSSGSSKGWWGIDGNVESFLDQLITWRELGYNMCSHRNDYDRYSSLPEWAQKTLEAHLRDQRDFQYALSEFESSATHDALWNAAQTELVREGRIHNYLRMLWGKKILQWTESPRDALSIMIELNNKYALDGRNPNSYSGIFWILGRYDRAWGPERPVFGKIRYMSSKNTARKYKVADYITEYTSDEIRQ